MKVLPTTRKLYVPCHAPSLCVLTVEQIASSGLSTLSVYDRFALLPTPGRAVLSSVLRRTAPAHLDAPPSIH